MKCSFLLSVFLDHFLKKIGTALCLAFFISNCVYAQSPQSFSFQAVVRDGSGDLVTSSAVGMRISLLQGSASGTAVYVETHTPTTNANGLASVQVGGGSVVSGTFASIDWAAGPYYIKSETDPNGGTSYSITGTQQLNSVPYALFAANAGNGGGLDDGSEAGNTPYWNGAEWVTNSSNIFNNGGNVGIGTNLPVGRLHVLSEPQIAETLDQYSVDGGSVTFSSSATNWQSFTAGVTGALSKIELACSSPTGESSSSGTLSVYGGEGVDGPLLWTNTVIYVSNYFSQSFTLSSPPNVTVGNIYTFQFSAPEVQVDWVVVNENNPYIQGRSNISSSSDHLFITYVTTGNAVDLAFVNGKFGIGTANPTTTLEVVGQVKIAGGSPGAGKVLVSDANGLASWSSGPVGPTGPTGLLTSGSVAGNTPYWNGSSWVTNSSNIYNNGGNVGIGTVSANAKLHVADEGRFETTNGIIRLTPTGWRVAERAQLKVYSKAANPAELDLGHTDGGIEYGWQVSARGSSDLRKLIVYSRQDGVFTSRFTVQHTDGNVGIGTTNPAEKMEVAGKVRAEGYTTRSGTLGAYGGNIFNFNWTGSAMQLWVDDQNVGTLAMTSDRRLKDRINPLTDNAIDRVMALRPVDFYYKDIKGTIFAGSPVQQEGFIADELQAVIPSAVNGAKDGMTEDGKIQPQTVNVMPVVSVLTKAMQEQQAIIAEQQALIEAMRTENGALRSDVNLLKTSVEILQDMISGRAQR